MARRKRGRPLHGWLVVDKPTGMGSTSVVSKARWALRAQKAGHAGTLDPLATGVLAIAFGEATKTVPYAMDGAKRYRFTVRWGAATDTDDAEGRVTAERDLRPTRAAIAAALPAFIGEVQQRPPQFSAIKIAGERAYARAREGETVALAARPIRIDALDLIETPDPDHAVLEMTCGKGGYVRAVARDLGESLGCLGHVAALRRLSSGAFSTAQAISIETLEGMRDDPYAEERLLPVETALDDIPALAVDLGRAAQIRQGRAVPAVGCTLSYGDAAWASLDGRPVALGVVKAGAFHPSRVFNLDPERDKREDPDVDYA